MTYDPVAYWTAAGVDTEQIDHEARFVHSDVFAAQEQALLDVLASLEFRSILEVGCGWGRITKLVADAYPDVPYSAIDLSPERIASAREKAPSVDFTESTLEAFKSRRKWDLVLAVEFLMHQPPGAVVDAVERLERFTRHHLVTLDWTADLGTTPIAAWNARHEYPDLYGDLLARTVPIGLQTIHVVEMKP